MADSYVCQQGFPSGFTLTPIFIVPVGKKAVISTISVCNQSAEDSRFRIAIAIANAADTSKQYLYYDEPIRGNRTFSATQGWTLNAGDVIRAYTNGSMSTMVFGVLQDV